MVCTAGSLIDALLHTLLTFEPEFATKAVPDIAGQTPCRAPSVQSSTLQCRSQGQDSTVTERVHEPHSQDEPEYEARLQDGVHNGPKVLHSIWLHHGQSPAEGKHWIWLCSLTLGGQKVMSPLR